MTTSEARTLRIVIAGLGLLLLFGGCGASISARETQYVCVGRDFDCAVDVSPSWVWPLGVLSGVGGPALLLVALKITSKDEDEAEKAAIADYVRKGRDVISAVRERDGGACREFGAMDGSDVVYRTSSVPAVRDPLRYDPSQMIVACPVHQRGLPLARLVLNVPIGG